MTDLLPFVWRFGMELDLTTMTETAKIPEGLRITTWRGAHESQLAALVHRAYRHTDDPRWSPELRSPETCLNLVKILKRDWELSRILWKGSEPVGMLHASQDRNGRAYVDNLCVEPDLRVGAGRALLLTCAWHFREDGMHRLWLDVTASSTRAVTLYESVGFVDRQWYLRLIKSGN